MPQKRSQVAPDAHRTAGRSLDVMYRYRHFSIEERNTSTFSEHLATTLDEIARMGGSVVHLTTTTLSHEVELLYVAHIVATFPKR